MSKIRIAILEGGADENQLMPLKMSTRDESDMIHASNVRHDFDRMLHNLIDTNKLPISENDFEVFLLPNSFLGMRWCIDNDIDIVNMSYADWWWILEQDMIKLEHELHEKCFCVTSQGNTGDEGIGASLRDGWLGVGSVDEMMNPRDYSSTGCECVAIDGYYGRYGTSFSSPAVVAILAVFARMHQRKLNYKPMPRHYERFIIKNCTDIHDKGWDLKTGYGLLEVPNRWVFEELRMRENSQDAEHYIFINDNEPIVKNVKLDVPIHYVNQRTVLSATDFIRFAGGSKTWIQDLRESRYSI